MSHLFDKSTCLLAHGVERKSPSFHHAMLSACLMRLGFRPTGRCVLGAKTLSTCGNKIGLQWSRDSRFPPRWPSSCLTREYPRWCQALASEDKKPEIPPTVTRFPSLCLASLPTPVVLPAPRPSCCVPVEPSCAGLDRRPCSAPPESDISSHFKEIRMRFG